MMSGVGGVEPETVTGCGVWIKGGKCGEDGLCGTCWAKREGVHVPTLRANLRLVEEELRQAREERDELAKDADEIAFALVKRTQQRDKAEADRDRLAGDLRACRAALDWYAKEDRYDVGRASSRPVVLADRGLLARRALAALSPVQGEHEQDGEGAEERYDRMMRERGFVSAADLCDPDWDEPSDGDTEETT